MLVSGAAVLASEFLEEIRILKTALEGDKFLDGQGGVALDNCASRLEASIDALATKPAKRRAKERDFQWRLVIPETLPISFRPTTSLDGHMADIRADIYGAIARPGTDGRPTQDHSLTVRIWSTSPTLMYRKDWDSGRIEDVDGARGRVMLRFRVDHAQRGPLEPYFHLQIGGGARGSNEFCWHPEELEIPRFVHLPLSLIGAAEMVVLALYPNAFSNLVRDPGWQIASRRAQSAYVLPYVRLLAECLFQRVTPRASAENLLLHLVNANRS